MNRREFLGVTSVAALAAGKGSKMTEGGDDPLGVRRDFPLVLQELYFNSAYIAPTPSIVEEAGLAFVRSKSRQPISLGDMLAKTDEVRAKFARLVGADQKEIGFLFATSEGENLVARAIGLRPGDNVVIDDLHYDTTYVLYKHLEAEVGVELRIARHRDGAATTEAFENLVDRRTRLISVAWVSHQNGFRHNLKALSQLAHAHGAYLYTDAIQAVGMFPMDLHAEGVDFLATGTYKWLLASYGVAPFYVRAELLDRLEPDRMGHLHVEKQVGEYQYQIYRTAKKLEYATLAFGPVYQLEAAIDYLKRVGLDRIEAHTVGLAHRLRQGLVERGFRVTTPPGNGSSIVSFIHDRDPDALARAFDRERVRVSLRDERRQVRVGIALFNTTQEIDRLLSVLDRLA